MINTYGRKGILHALSHAFNSLASFGIYFFFFLSFAYLPTYFFIMLSLLLKVDFLFASSSYNCMYMYTQFPRHVIVMKFSRSKRAVNKSILSCLLTLSLTLLQSIQLYFISLFPSYLFIIKTWWRRKLKLNGKKMLSEEKIDVMY